MAGAAPCTASGAATAPLSSPSRKWPTPSSSTGRACPHKRMGKQLILFFQGLYRPHGTRSPPVAASSSSRRACHADAGGEHHRLVHHLVIDMLKMRLTRMVIDCSGKRGVAWSCTSTSWCQLRCLHPEWAWWSTRQRACLGPTSLPQPTSPLQASQTDRYSSWPEYHAGQSVASALHINSVQRADHALDLQRGYICSGLRCGSRQGSCS